MDTGVQDGPSAQDVVIELAYAKYMAALATHTRRPLAPFSGDGRDCLLVSALPTGPMPDKPAQ